MPVVSLTPLEWSVTHTPAANTAATISRAAQPGIVHVVRSITASVTGDVAASAAVQVNLRDSTTGAGNVLWSCVLRGTVTAGNVVSVPVNIQGVRGQAVTLEFTAAGGAGTFESVAMTGYSDSQI